MEGFTGKTPALHSWDDVDRALREMGECEIAVSTIQADMNIAITAAKEKATNLAAPMTKRVNALKALIQDFAEGAKGSLEGKSKALTFGKVGFRQSSRVSLPTMKIATIIANLKKFGMGDCIVTKESVSKEALEKYPDKDIVRVGASRKVEDKFFLEPDLEKLRRT